MKIHQIKKTFFSQNKYWKKNLGFTLVELIVVITILVILATIALLSFQNYTKDARNSNRVSTLKNIETGLELYFVKTWRFPMPEWNILTGTMNGKDIMYSWEIWENIVKAINLNKLAQDPTLGQNYKYWITSNKLEYNLWWIRESETLAQNIIPTTYAASYYGQVVGNYKWYIKYSTGSTHYITNVPSLIYTYTGSINDIFSEKDNVYFVTDSGKNIPYEVSGEANNETPNKVIARKTWKTNAQFENINITEIVNAKTNEEKKAKIDEILGSDPIVKQVILDSFWAENSDIFETIINGTIPNVSDNNNNNGGWSTPSSEISWACQTPPTHALFFNNSNSYSVENVSTLSSSFKLIPSTNTCEFTCEDDYTWDGNSCRLATEEFYVSDGVLSNDYGIRCNEEDTIVLPTKINSELVTWIGDNLLSWAWCKNIIIPPSITSIWFDAFSHNQITSITIPNSVTYIDNSAFSNNQLTSITIPNSVTYIWPGAFQNNQLTSISIPIPNSVKEIWQAAFNNNQLPDNQAIIYKRNSDGSIDTTTIISYWWANKTPIIPSNVTTIWENAFSYNSLTSIDIPNNITRIEKNAFQVNNLTTITIPDNVINLWEWAFSSNKITSFTLPNNITTIPNSLFENNLLQSITIPNSVTHINNSAFARNKLTSLSIPNSVTNIWHQAFSDNQLTLISIPNNVTNLWNSVFLNNKITSFTLPNNMTTIPSGSFKNNLLTSVSIPNHITRIEDDAFRDNKLISITIPNSVIYIWGSTFRWNWANNTSSSYLAGWISWVSWTWTLSWINWEKQ